MVQQIINFFQKLSYLRWHKWKDFQADFSDLYPLLLIGNVLKLLFKSLFVTLELTKAAAATDTAVQKKNFGSETAILIIQIKK